MNNKFSIALTNKGFHELNPVDAGYEKCESGHSFGPHIRNNYLIHYVKKGTGTFIKAGKAYRVHEGEAFLICPNEVCTYFADKNDPWEYIWLGFTGEYAEKFKALGAVFNADGEIFETILNAADYENCASEYLAGVAFSLYASLFSKEKKSSDFVSRACGYIKANYMNNIKICDIAEILCVDRTYLAKIFKKEKGLSMQAYLVKVRLDKAEKLLLMGYTVSNAAYMSGYTDVCNFSKMFKRKKGVSPGEVGKQKASARAVL